MEQKIQESPTENASGYEPEYMTLAEVAKKMRFSYDTLHRRMIAGKLNEIVWVDFLQNGKLRATRESVDAFIQSRLAATQELYNRPLRQPQ